jgi:hypothetical protein
MGVIVQVEEYTGTLESLENLVDKLKLDSNDYNFDVKSKSLYIHKLGLLYRPGDHYQYRLPENFECI